MTDSLIGTPYHFPCCLIETSYSPNCWAFKCDFIWTSIPALRLMLSKCIWVINLSAVRHCCSRKHTDDAAAEPRNSKMILQQSLSAVHAGENISKDSQTVETKWNFQVSQGIYICSPICSSGQESLLPLLAHIKTRN